MYNMFNPLYSLVKCTYVTFIFQLHTKPVVGTLGKFPNQHLFQSKLYFSISKLWATIEISISAQLSIKSIFSNIISINHWQNFAVHPIWYINFMFNVLPNGKFLLFLFLFGILAIKAMAFWEILPLALLHASSYVSCMVKWEISNISLSVWHVGCQSCGILGNVAVFPPKSAISQMCQNKLNNLIPPSYGLHFGKYKMGIIGVKYTIFMQNAM